MKKFFSTSEVAKLCNVHRNTIINAIKTGALKAHKTPGGHSRIAIEELMEFCKNKGLDVTEILHTKNRVLIIDDDKDLAEILAAGLELENYKVVTAHNGYDAGFLTIDFNPDIIILDVLLPDINGDVVCKRIRSHSETKDTKIIAISGVMNPGIEKQMLDAGADTFLAKPFDLNAITKLLEKLTS